MEKRHRLISFALCLSLVLTLLSSAVLAEEVEMGAASPTFPEPVYTPTIANRFPDPNFAAVVAGAMGCSVDSAPEEEEYDLTRLDAGNAEISSIEGIEVFRRLQYLDLSNNALKQVHVHLKHLHKLEHLLLHGNQLEALPDIFDAFPKLSDISLYNNPCIDDTGTLASTLPILAKLPVQCDVRLLSSSGWRALKNRKAWLYQDYQWIFHGVFLEESHRVLRREWKAFQGDWYYFGDDFLMHVGWLKDGGKWYYLRPHSGPEPPGIMLTPIEGIMHTGWLKYGGKWYYLKPGSGAMATGWFKVGKDWYYANANGVMQTGWVKVGGKWYYFKPTGQMQTGWLRYGGNWYYLKTTGEMATGWLMIDGKWYCFRSNGAMYHSGTYTIGGKRYRFDSNGVWIP